MKVKKTIWIPIVIGIVFGSLILAASEANFFIPLGNDTSMGIGELFTTLSAALGGPIAAIVTIFFVYSVHSLLHPDLYSIYILLADATAHFSGMLIVAIIYYQLVYPQAKKTSVFLAGWWLTIGVYYYLAFLPLEVVLLNLADPDFGPAYPAFARDFFPEFLGTALITGLIWLAAPAHYRRPLWHEPKKTTEKNVEIQAQ